MSYPSGLQVRTGGNSVFFYRDYGYFTVSELRKMQGEPGSADNPGQVIRMDADLGIPSGMPPPAAAITGIEYILNHYVFFMVFQ